MSDDLSVAGGAGGTEAVLEDIDILSNCSRELAGDLYQIAVTCHGYLLDPNVAASAVLDPAGAAAFELALLSALDGSHGLTTLSERVGGRGDALAQAAANYRAADEAQAQAMRAVQQLRILNGGASDQVLADGIDLVHALLDGESADEWIAEHPGAMDDVLRLFPPDSPGQPPTLQALALVFGQFWPDGTPTVTPIKTITNRRQQQVPTGVADLIDSLAVTNAAAGPSNDQITVRVLTAADGSQSYIVDIPGTQSWPGPGSESSSPNDLGTNIRVLGGETTTREEAIAMALTAAGASS